MDTKRAKSETKKSPATKAMKKKGSHKPAAAARKTPRAAVAESWDDQAPVEAVVLHERVEPRELSHERLRNPPEETAMPAPDDDLVDDVAAGANELEGGAAEDCDDA